MAPKRKTPDNDKKTKVASKVVKKSKINAPKATSSTSSSSRSSSSKADMKKKQLVKKEEDPHDNADEADSLLDMNEIFANKKAKSKATLDAEAEAEAEAAEAKAARRRRGPPEDELNFMGKYNGKGDRRLTEEGYPVYSLEEMKINPNSGGTPDCPFDCWCCH